MKGFLTCIIKIYTEETILPSTYFIYNYVWKIKLKLKTECEMSGDKVKINGSQECVYQ